MKLPLNIVFIPSKVNQLVQILTELEANHFLDKSREENQGQEDATEIQQISNSQARFDYRIWSVISTIVHVGL